MGVSRLRSINVRAMVYLSANLMLSFALSERSMPF